MEYKIYTQFSVSQKTDYKSYRQIALKLASLVCVNVCLLQGRLEVTLLPLALLPFCASLLFAPSSGLPWSLLVFKTRIKSWQEIIKWFYRNVKLSSYNVCPFSL